MKLYCTIDTNYVEVNRISNTMIKGIIEQQISYLGLPCQVIILMYDFTRDHYNRIRRDLYDESYVNGSIVTCESLLSR